MNAYVAADQVRGAVRAYRGGVDYANTRFATSMKLIAQMIAGKLPTKVYYAHITGFDTHAAPPGLRRPAAEPHGSGGRRPQARHRLPLRVRDHPRSLAGDGSAEDPR